MHKLENCHSFVASVELRDNKPFVLLWGRGYDINQDLEFDVKVSKEFESKQACMDFFNNFTDTNYKFDEDDFLFVSDRCIPINYFGCGVDFDED